MGGSSEQETKRKKKDITNEKDVIKEEKTKGQKQKQKNEKDIEVE